MLKFGKNNAKLVRLEKYVGKVYTFSLLSGFSCPFAEACLSKAVRGPDGKTTVKDGPKTQFRCFSASEEALYPNVYDQRNNNFQQLLAIKDNISEMVNLLLEAIPAAAKCVRVHVGGDMFSQNYFDAWMYASQHFPDKLFYAYTKSLPYWLDARSRQIIPDNFVLTASRGGRHNELIDSEGLREAVVIADPEVCQAVIDSGNHDIVPIGPYAGYEIDHSDEHAALPEKRNQSFALLIHGTQPKGSKSAQSKNVLKGVGSYSKGNNV